MHSAGATPASKLEGLTLEGGWVVVKRLERHAAATGGFFSQGYLVDGPDGTRGYLKALDFREALGAGDPAARLQQITEAFNYERVALEKCRRSRMDRVVLAVADGKVEVDGEPVQYIIFELAEHGDIRIRAISQPQSEFSWSFRILHQIAVGLRQLHQGGMAHQDLKPSNVLLFESDESKIADLGRSAYRGHPSPHQDSRVAGDSSYAPPELLYGYVSGDWNARRLGCDMYLLGSMLVFFLTGVSMTALVQDRLLPAQRWRTYRGQFEDLLPDLRHTTDEILAEIEPTIPPRLRSEVRMILNQLCDPDIRLRGHPRDRRSTNPYSLERYIALFDLLARRSQMERYQS